MTKSKITWIVLSLLYLLFFGWYTSFDGPLTAEEVEEALAQFEGQEGRDPEMMKILRDFLESDTGDDFVMLNVIDLYETPLQVEGVVAGETSQQVLAKYMEYMTPALFARACHPVFYGAAAGLAMEMFGVEGIRSWTVGAGMRYRSRRDLVEIASNPAFQGAHEFKIASMRKTFAFPVDPWFHLGDPRFVLALFFLIIGLTTSLLGARAKLA